MESYEQIRSKAANPNYMIDSFPELLNLGNIDVCGIFSVKVCRLRKKY